MQKAKIRKIVLKKKNLEALLLDINDLLQSSAKLKIIWFYTEQIN